MLIYEKIRENAENMPHQVALVSQDNSVTYEEMWKWIQKTAQEFFSDKVPGKERVLILLPNCMEFVVSFFALSCSGKIAVLADIKLKKELYHIIKENRISCIITDLEGKEKIYDIFNEIESNDSLNIMAGIKIILKDEIKKLLFNLNSGEYSNSINRDIPIEKTAMILYTSGSTGIPKGVVNTNYTLLTALKNYLDTVEITQEDKLVAVSPFFHSYGFGSCMLAGLAAGATLLILKDFKPRNILEVIDQKKATIFHAVPFMFRMINQQFDVECYNIESLRFCVSAGAPLSLEVAQTFFIKTGKVIHQEYGSSETGTIAINLSNEIELNVESVGCSLKNVDVRIQHPNDEGYGIIEVKSDGCSKSYIGEERFPQGWFTTGDTGRVDEKGYIYVAGRNDRLINIEGMKVDALEIETLLKTHPKIIDVLVRGIKNTEGINGIEALIVCGEESLGKDEIKIFCSRHLASYKVPRVINWIEAIPKTDLGKTMYWKVKDNIRTR